MRWQIFQAPHSNNPILSVYRGVGGIVMRIRWSTQCVSRRLIMINLGTAWLLWLMFLVSQLLVRSHLVINYCVWCLHCYIHSNSGWFYLYSVLCKSILGFYSWHFVKIKWKVDFSLIRAQKSLFKFLRLRPLYCGSVLGLMSEQFMQTPELANSKPHFKLPAFRESRLPSQASWLSSWSPGE